jgi:CheY-like chemotaxis protein
VTTFRPILLVEDDANDVDLTLSALGEFGIANPIVVLRDGAEALDYLFRRGNYEQREAGLPVVVLLDLKMPKVTGLEVLRQIKRDPALHRVPTVMLTSSREERDLAASYSTGVNAYVVKPVSFQDFVAAIRGLGMFWAVINEPPLEHTGDVPAEHAGQAV